MIVSKCPSCRESVTVPDASRQARVRCPLCQDEYTLAEVFERCPPLLELLDAPAETAEEGFAGGFALGGEVGDEVVGVPAADDTFEATDDLAAAPSFDFGEAPAPAAGPADAAKTTSTRPVSRRPRAKGKNPAIEIVKVVVGGAFGLFIAQMLLWWLPFDLNKGQRDPTSLGANIGPYVPWLVPASVRGAAESNPPEAAGNDNDGPPPPDDSVWGDAAREQEARQSNQGRPAKNQGGNRQGGRPKNNRPSAPGNQPLDLPDADSVANNDPGAGNTPAQPGDLPGAVTLPADDLPDPLGGQQPDLLGAGGELPLPTEGAFDPEADDARPTTPPADEKTSNEGATKPAPQTSGFKARPKQSPDDLVAAIDAAQAANSAYDAERGLELANRLYASLSALGQVMGHVSPGDQAKLVPQLVRLNEWLSSLDRNKYNGLGTLAAGWLTDENRGNNGVALVGTVLALEPLDGDYYQSRIKLANSEKTVNVVGWVKPPADFQVGARVLILGEIVDAPAEKLIGFPGSDAEVVCGAYSQVLGPAEPPLEESSTDPEAN